MESAAAAIEALQLQGRGTRLAVRVTADADLDIMISRSDSVKLCIPSLGLEANSSSTTAELSLRDMLHEMITVLEPSLAYTSAGEAIVTQLKNWSNRNLSQSTNYSPWVLVVEDLSGTVRLTEHPSRSMELQIAVTAIPSFKDSLPYQAKVVQVDSLLDLPDTNATAFPWEIRLAEQAGRGIGSLTFAGALVLATHMAKCFPDGFWRGKRIIEVGGGAGLLGVFVASLGAHITVTDRREYIELIEMNAKLNEELLNKRGGSVRATVLDWTCAADREACAAEGPYDFVIGADIVYPHERDSSEVIDGLVATLAKLVQGSTVGIIHHSFRGSEGERDFFFSAMPQFFSMKRVERRSISDPKLSKIIIAHDFLQSLPGDPDTDSCTCGLNFSKFVHVWRSSHNVKGLIFEEQYFDDKDSNDWPGHYADPFPTEKLQQDLFERLDGVLSQVIPCVHDTVDTATLHPCEKEDFEFSTLPCAIHTLIARS